MEDGHFVIFVISMEQMHLFFQFCTSVFICGGRFVCLTKRRIDVVDLCASRGLATRCLVILGATFIQ